MIHGKMQKPIQNQWEKVLGKKLILALQLRLLPCSRICSVEVDYGVKKVKSCGISIEQGILNMSDAIVLHLPVNLLLSVEVQFQNVNSFRGKLCKE